jgi:hypothetical protein
MESHTLCQFQNALGMIFPLDFVTRLPSSNGFDAIWIVTDYLTKLQHFAHYSTAINPHSFAELYLSIIFYHDSLPNTVVSDQGPQFASCFWKHLCNSLQIEPY